jgi:hypothetical protein
LIFAIAINEIRRLLEADVATRRAGSLGSLQTICFPIRAVAGVSVEVDVIAAGRDPAIRQAGLG